MPRRAGRKAGPCIGGPRQIWLSIPHEMDIMGREI